MSDPTGAVEDKTTEDKTTEGKRKRGAGFPVLSLREAVRIVHEAGAHGMEHSSSAFAGYAGHDSATSGPAKRKLATFKDWGLISTTGDRVILTDRARRFALSVDPLSEGEALREAFHGCQIMNALYEAIPRNRPTKPDVLKRKAVLDYRISTDSSDRFLASLTDSAVVAGLARVDDATGEITFLTVAGTSDDVGQAVDDESDLATTGPNNFVSPTVGVSGGDAPEVIRQSLPFEGGQLILSVRSQSALPASAFALIGDVVAAMTKLADALGAPSAEADDGSA